MLYENSIVVQAFAKKHTINQYGISAQAAMRDIFCGNPKDLVWHKSRIMHVQLRKSRCQKPRQ
jgi:hypothetical protein